MASLLRFAENDNILFWCPGCDRAHGINTGPNGWTWNGDEEKPTISPSILTKYFVMSEKGRAELDAYHVTGGGPLDQRFDGKDVVCHSFVTDGRIQFLDDCTHELAGQTVDLAPFPGD